MSVCSTYTCTFSVRSGINYYYTVTRRAFGDFNNGQRRTARADLVEARLRHVISAGRIVEEQKAISSPTRSLYTVRYCVRSVPRERCTFRGGALSCVNNGRTGFFAKTRRPRRSTRVSRRRRVVKLLAFLSRTIAH